MTPNNFIKSLSIIHFALLFGMIMFCAVVYFTHDDWIFNYAATDNVFFFLVPILAVGGIVIGNILFRNRIENLSSKSSLAEKLSEFRTAAILKYALIEGPALLGCVAALLSGNLFFLFISGLLILFFFTQRPSMFNVEQKLNLNREQGNQFSKTDEPFN